MVDVGDDREVADAGLVDGHGGRRRVVAAQPAGSLLQGEPVARSRAGTSPPATWPPRRARRPWPRTAHHPRGAAGSRRSRPGSAAAAPIETVSVGAPRPRRSRAGGRATSNALSRSDPGEQGGELVASDAVERVSRAQPLGQHASTVAAQDAVALGVAVQVVVRLEVVDVDHQHPDGARPRRPRPVRCGRCRDDRARSGGPWPPARAGGAPSRRSAGRPEALAASSSSSSRCPVSRGVSSLARRPRGSGPARSAARPGRPRRPAAAPRCRDRSPPRRWLRRRCRPSIRRA